MRKSLRGLALGLLGLIAAGAVAKDAPSPIGAKVEDFTLRDYRGKEHSLASYADRKVVVLVFLGTECPLAKLYGPRLAALDEQFKGKGAVILGVSSNQQDSVTELASFARVHNIAFPILKDPGNTFADKVGAQRTPEAFVLDADRVVRYHGRIDDQYGFMDNGVAYQRPAPKQRDLASAVESLLAGKPVAVASTKVNGCLIGRVNRPKVDSDVTYSNQISRLLNDRCVSCHRPGQIAPFPLRNYQEVVGWAEMIKEVTSDRRMPPWHADPKFSKFANDCRLSDEQVDLVARWVAAGAPEGDPAQAPPPPSFTDGWMIEKPDQIVGMAEEFECPAEGTVEYQRFTIDPGWKEDKWIKSLECRPGNPAVVHHIIVYLRPPSAGRKGSAGRLTTDWLAAYAPGLRVPDLDNGLARYAPAGSTLIFEVHYTPNGVKQKDKSYAGFVFADPKDVKKEVAVKNAGNFSFVIPPHAENHEVKSVYNFREDTLLISVSPHMHLRGKDFLYELVYPGGKRETILWVPKYDFGWQTTYTFTEPMKLPRGTRMECTAHYDNSEHNLANPDPNAEVRLGEQTWEEMMFGWFEMALANQDLSKPSSEKSSRLTDFLAGLENAKSDTQFTYLASKATRSHEDFGTFAFYLDNVAPQVDRVCVTYVDDEGLKLLDVFERNGLKTTFQSKATVYPLKNQGLADAALADKPTVFADINQANGLVMRKMVARGVQSSLHVPVTVNGKKGTLNFWSTDPNAFPPQAVDLLSKAALALGAK